MCGSVSYFANNLPSRCQIKFPYHARNFRWRKIASRLAGPTRMYLSRCKEYLVAGPEENWDGVYVMAHK